MNLPEFTAKASIFTSRENYLTDTARETEAEAYLSGLHLFVSGFCNTTSLQKCKANCMSFECSRGCYYTWCPSIASEM